MDPSLPKTGLPQASRKMVVKISQDDETFYTKLQWKLFKVVNASAPTVVDDIIDQLVEAQVVDYNDVEGRCIRDIFRSFHKKEKDAIIKFLNELCNLKGNPLTSQQFRKIINKAFPGSVVSVPIHEKTEEHVINTRKLKRSHKNDSGYSSSEVKRSKSCLEMDLCVSDGDFKSQNVPLCNVLRERRLSLPTAFYEIRSSDNRIPLNNLSPLTNSILSLTPNEVGCQQRNTDHTSVQIEHEPVYDSENIENKQPLLASSVSSRPKGSKRMTKSVRNFVLGTATVILSGVAGAIASRYCTWGNSIEIPTSTTLSTQVALYNIENTTVTNTNQDIIRYQRVLENGMKQYSFERKRNS